MISATVDSSSRGHTPDPQGRVESLHRQLAALLRVGLPPGSPLTSPAPPAGDRQAPHPLDAQQWEQAAALARSERLDSLLYVALLGSRRLDEPPAAVSAALQGAYWRTKIANLLAWNALRECSGACAALQVPVVLLKGGALAFTLYDDPATRPLGDLDLLVHERDVAKARQLLHLLGYTPVPDINEGRQASCFQTAGSVRRLARSSEVTYVRDGKLPIQVDLHWGLSSHTALRRSLDPTWFWQHVRPLGGGDDGLLVWDNEAQLLHLCAHMLQHGRPRLRWTYDIALLLGRRSLDWELVLATAEAGGLVLAVQEALAAVALLWGIAPPPAAAARLGALNVTRDERRLQRLTAAGDRRALAACNLLTCRDLPAAVDAWLSAAFPSPSYMCGRYRLAGNRLLPAFYLYRAVFGTADAGRRAWRVLYRSPSAEEQDGQGSFLERER